MVQRINIWSSPRNVSTALMYSWRQRPDTTVVDEPLYAHYLRTSGRIHPGADEVLASQDSDGAAVIDTVILGPYDCPVVVFKQMAKHLLGLDRSFLGRCSNVLLTRDPLDMLTSFQKRIPDATIEDTGLVELVEILDSALAAGDRPIVIDSKVLLLDPESTLRTLCGLLDLEFDPVMLSWPPGPKPEDGVWAPYWYERVHRSTGWDRWEPKQDQLLPELEPVLAEARTLYDRLAAHAIG